MADDKRHNEAPWFRHDTDADQDPKIERLIALYGNAGVGVYWRLAQRMRAQGGRLRLVDIPVLASTLGFQDLPKMIEEACGEEWQLYQKDERYFWSKRSVAEAQLAADSRNRSADNGRKGAEKRWHGVAIAKPLENNGHPIARQRRQDSTDLPTNRPTDRGEISSGENSPNPAPPSLVDNPDPPSREGPQFEVAAEFARRYFAKTGRPLVPIEEHFAQALKLLRQLGGDKQSALEAVGRYFDESWWFTEDKRTKKPSYSFAGFCSHASEILAAGNGHRKRASPECPACGSTVLGSERSCLRCGLDRAVWKDPGAVAEHKRYLAEAPV